MVLLAAAGLVMVLFGLGAYYATDELSAFSIGNLLLGAVLLVVAALGQWWSAPGIRGARPRRVAGRSVALLAGVAGAAARTAGAGIPLGKAGVGCGPAGGTGCNALLGNGNGRGGSDVGTPN